MERPHHRVLAFAANIVPLLLAMVSLQNIPTVSSVTPYVVTGAGYVNVNGTLYIQGGGRLFAQGGRHDDTNSTSAFVSLSLTRPWNDTSPPWEALSLPTQYEYESRNLFQGLAATPDRARLVFWGKFLNDFNRSATDPPQNDAFKVYNLLDRTWSKITFLSIQVTEGGVPIVIDPASGNGLGVLYAPSGCSHVNVPGDYRMCQMALDTKKISLSRMPGGLVPKSIRYFSWVYCTSRKTMLLYGGIGAQGQPNVSLYEFTASTSTWSLIQPIGSPPGDIQRHCMVETSDGSKMIVFGGMSVTEQVSSRLFILHINNLTWTEGPDVGGANARMGHVCATNGDSFIAWGGLTIQNGKAVVVTDIPLIYNIPNNTWVRNFVVTNQSPTLPSGTASVLTPNPSPTSSNNDGSLPPPPTPPKKSFNLGAAAGGAAGAIIVLAAIGFFIFRWRKRVRNSGRHPSQLKRSGSDNPADSKKAGGFVGRDSRDDDSEDRHHNGDNPGIHAVQLQRSAQHSSDPYDPYPASSAHYQQQFQSSQPQTGSMPFTYGVSLYSGGFSGGLDSPRFSGVNSPSPPPPFQSGMSMSPVGSPHESLSTFPAHQHGQSAYYDGGSEVFQSPLKSPNHQPSGGYSQYIPIGSERLDLRSPQHLGPGHDTSPAAWMAAMNVRNSVGNPHSILSQHLDNKGEMNTRGSYYPPPPGQQSPVSSESELMQKKLMLMKAQHELELVKMQLEQETQRQKIGRQFVQGSG